MKSIIPELKNLIEGLNSRSEMVEEGKKNPEKLKGAQETLSSLRIEMKISGVRGCKYYQGNQHMHNGNVSMKVREARMPEWEQREGGRAEKVAQILAPDSPHVKKNIN